MRIVLDLQACQAASMHRGIGRYTLALALAMVRNRQEHDVRIVLNDAFPTSAATLRATFGALLPDTAITGFSTPLPASEGSHANRWRLLAAERIREAYLASLRPDVVHVGSLFEGFSDNSITSVLHGDGQFDTAVTLYDLIPLLRKERYLSDPNIATWYQRKLDSMKRAELLVAISAHARAEAIDALHLAPDRVVNISSAADSIFCQRTLEPDERASLLARHGLRRPFIMYTGGIDYRKNIEGLIAAYAALPGTIRQQYQLAIVCTIQDADRGRLQRLAARHRLADGDLALTGFVSDADLVALYNCTALFVFPSLHEGFGLPVLEAMACGAPVIGSNTSSIPEVVGRADALFDPTDVPAMSVAMARVLGDPGYAADLRRHGLAQARLFSWDASAQRAIAAFEACHARRVPAPIRVHGSASLALVLPRNATPRPQLLAAGYTVTLVQPDENGAWFDGHAHTFDRIVYQFSNTAACAPLFALLERHPGVVLLDDFFLNEAVRHVDEPRRARYLAHGYQALDESEAYPCNLVVLARATGIICPTGAALAHYRHWYAGEAPRDWQVAGFDVAPALLRAAIEACDHSDGATRQRLVDAIADVDASPAPGDLIQVAAAVAANAHRLCGRQILVDVTENTQDALILELIRTAPPSWRVEPIRHDGRRYRYARASTLALLGCTDLALEDTVADAGLGDVFLYTGQGLLFPPAWAARGVVSRPLAPGPDNAESAARLLQQLPCH